MKTTPMDRESMIIGSKVRLRGKRLADAPDDYAW